MAIFSGLAAAIGGLLGGTFLSGAVGSFLIKAAVGIGLNLLASSLAGQPEKPTFSVQGQLQAGGDVSRSFILGTTATGGSLVYANTWGNEGKTPNAYFTQVIALADVPTRGLAAVWVNGEKCTLLTGSAHADYGIPVQEYRVKGKDYLWIKFYDGTQTTADAFLVSKVGSAARPYQNTRVGIGVSYAICTARINDKLFTGFPTYKFEVRGSKLYDITKDSTAGGSGAHRLDNPATWGGDGDDLPAVHVYSLLLGQHFGSDWFYGLQGVSPARLPSGNWRAQINKCRLAVDKPGGGTEAQYLAGLEVQVNAPIADAVSAFLSSCQGRLIDSGGVYTLRVGAPDAAVFSFSDDDILSTEQQTFTPFFGLADTINGISATYPEPAEGWNAKPAPSLFRPDLEAKDGNRRLLANVELGAVSRSSQVQRLMKSALEEARRARRHTLVLGPSAWPLEPGDTVLWTSQRNGYTAKLMRVDGVVDKANLDVILDLTEVDPSDYNWNPATDYVPPTYGWLGPVRPSPQEIVAWSASPASIDDASGTGRRPAIRLAWDGDVDDVVAVAYQIRLSASGQVVYRGRTEDVEAGSILISQNLLPATGYQARGWYVPRNDREVEPSGWLSVVTPDLRINTDDILDAAIKDLKIADRAVKTLKIELEAVKAELIANQAIISSKIAEAAITTTKFASGIEPVSIVPGSTVPTTKTTTVIMVNGKLYRWNGTTYKAEIDAADIAGTLKDAQIESVNASKILGTVIASQIADAAITTAKFANGIRPVEIVSTLPGAPHVQGRVVILTTDSKLYRNSGTGWVASVAAADISGQVQAAQIAALEAVKVTGQISGVQISDDAISSPKIAAGAIIASKMAVGAVVALAIAAGAVTTAKLDALAVTADKLAADSVIAGKVAAGAINAREIAAGAVTASKLFVGDTSNVYPDFDMADDDFYAGSSGVVYAIGNTGVSYNGARQISIQPGAANQNVLTKYFTVNQGADYYLEAVSRASAGGDPEILVQLVSVDGAGVYTITRTLSVISGSVSGKQTGAFTTDSAETKARLVFRNRAGASGVVYFSAPVIRRKAMGELIVDGEIIAIKIAAGAITTPKIAAGAVVASTIASGAVTTAKLDALAVTAEKLAADSVIAGKVAAGAINAREIAAGAISASKIAVGNFSNLVPDSEFQDQAAWNFYSGATLAATAGTSWGEGALGAIYATAFTGDGSTTFFSVARSALRAPVVGGRQYLMKTSMRRYNAGTGIGRMAAWFYDVSGALLGSRVTPTITTASTVPQEVSAVIVAYPGAVAVEVGFQYQPGGTSGVIFRTGYLAEMNAGELIVDGTIYSNALATNSVTTAKVLAGAITAVELGAGAVTAIKIAAGAVTADKVNVSSLAAISASFGNAIFTGYAASANGKLKLDFDTGGIEVWS